MPPTVSVGEFEGPLGLLLQLIERGNIVVTDISVATVTAQYLEHLHAVKEISPDQLSDFLVLGARLLHIKSLALLPGDNLEERTIELQRLNDELADYRRFQHLARQLAARGAHQTWERPVAEHLAATDLPLPNLTLTQLSSAYATALKRFRPVAEPTVIPAHISLEATIKQLRRRLATGFNLDELLATCADRLEIIVNFMAVLELVRQGAARVSQAGQFAIISVEPSHA